MMGRNHVVAGLGLGALGTSGLFLARRLQGFSWPGPTLPEPLEEIGQTLGSAVSFALDWIGSAASWVLSWLVVVDTAPWLYVYLVAGVVLFILGCLLPDIDSPSSLLGRRFSWLPLGPHRGITHSNWALLLLLAVSIPLQTRLLAFVWLGAVTHCVLDGFSTAGRVGFWPLGRYRVVTLPGGGGPCVVRKGYRRLSYRTGSMAETVLAWTLAGLGGASLLGMALL